MTIYRWSEWLRRVSFCLTNRFNEGFIRSAKLHRTKQIPEKVLQILGSGMAWSVLRLQFTKELGSDVPESVSILGGHYPLA